MICRGCCCCCRCHSSLASTKFRKGQVWRTYFRRAVTIDLDNSAFSVVLWGKIILEKNDRCPLDAARSPGMGATIVPKVQKRSSLIAVVSTEGHFSGLNNHFEILGRHANSRVQTGS
ncbi:hypothetical protein MPTK1_1g26660 [Marchantia polymorpha subsp. ruderalis]|uniref:Uncharacterized protein n=2 Tax=Marchantia polymorpha TaxID=3197 RepID=A0AAF6AUK9_MARPO|nr:hypothetical protein MARPO_0002s0212 [Marchantia polymorpha]BBN00130.1 hypothetical protein Mp_1g26660 [Marchantia polymorpha subsp. ruderalis]|eukprot:PTQ49754.1 hypothetical protein MARPO_0002s0212 [Marchantia polymorpha]